MFKNLKQISHCKLDIPSALLGLSNKSVTASWTFRLLCLGSQTNQSLCKFDIPSALLGLSNKSVTASWTFRMLCLDSQTNQSLQVGYSVCSALVRLANNLVFAIWSFRLIRCVNKTCKIKIIYYLYYFGVVLAKPERVV